MDDTATRSTPALAAALAAFLAAYVFLMFYHDDLVGIDYAHLTARSLIPMVISPESGRFFPLARQEYNLLRPLGQSAALYHAFGTLELLVVVACAWRLLREVPPPWRAAAVVFLFCLPSIAWSFFGVVYVERDLVAWLAAWLLCLDAWLTTRRRAAFWAALLVAQSLIYHKETAFLLVGAFATARVVIAAAPSASLLRQRRVGEWFRHHVLEWALLASCAAFAAVYLTLIAPGITDAYGATTNRAASAASALWYYARTDVLMVITTIVLAARITRAATGVAGALDAHWDALAIGALVFAAAYAVLGITRAHYLAPADFIAVLYLARLGAVAIVNPARWVRPAIGVVAVLVTLANAGESAAQWLDRRLAADAYVRMAAALRDDVQRAERGTVRLHFPQVGGFEVMEFAAFLRYKGWRAAHDAAHMGTGVSFTITTPRQPANGRCHASQPFICEQAAPAPGDYVVLLPGRQLTDAEIAHWRAAAVTVIAATPQWTVTQRLMRSLARGRLDPERTTAGYVLRYGG